MKVAVLGSLGNMGSRYCSILNCLNIPYDGFDLHNDEEALKNAKDYSHYIIATPTSSHLFFLNQLLPLNKRILCEKPLSKYYSSLAKELSRFARPALFMVNNYHYAYKLSKNGTCHLVGPTIYNYYNSGGDGLGWDCIQLIDLAKLDIELSNESPVWKCQINDVEIKRDSIDLSYIEMIRDFIADKLNYREMSELIALHEKAEYINGRIQSNNTSQYWRSSEDDKYKIP